MTNKELLKELMINGLCECDHDLDEGQFDLVVSHFTDYLFNVGVTVPAKCYNGECLENPLHDKCAKHMKCDSFCATYSDAERMFDGMCCDVCGKELSSCASLCHVKYNHVCLECLPKIVDVKKEEK